VIIGIFTAVLIWVLAPDGLENPYMSDDPVPIEETWLS